MTRDYLLEFPGRECVPVAMPEALPESGWYPTEYCIRYFPRRDQYTVSLESWARFAESGASEEDRNDDEDDDREEDD